MKRAPKEEPTIAMWEALADFRRRHGRYWRQALCLKWMSGEDEQDRHAAALRQARNLLGPSWLYRLRSARLDAEAVRVARLALLPVMCAATHPETGEPIVLKRGERGYWSLPDGIGLDAFNAASRPSPAQIAAMLAGSVFGWECPAADPASYDEEGRPLARRTDGRTSRKGGKGVGQGRMAGRGPFERKRRLSP